MPGALGRLLWNSNKMCWGKLAPFFQEPEFRVINAIPSNRRLPATRITAGEDVVIALTLAKAGFFNNNPGIVMQSPVDLVIQTYQFNSFLQVYESTTIELNKEQKWI